MKIIVSIIFFFLCLHGAFGKAALIYDQCDNTSYICKPGLNCVFVNQWYSQCQLNQGVANLKSVTRIPSSFKSCSFKYGNGVDYLNPGWLETSFGVNDWKDYNKAVTQNKTPLVYSYVIAFSARKDWGLKDCDVDANKNLCIEGANYIRQYRSKIIAIYQNHALRIAEIVGKLGVVVFLIEPDFVQYSELYKSQKNGGIPFADMKKLFDDIVNALKTSLPNALISWDISPWLKKTEMEKWWSYFKSSKIDYIHTSGGMADPSKANLGWDGITWKSMNQLTGKPIIADCGYGVGGASNDNCKRWDATNTANRVKDGVIALNGNSPVINPRPKTC